MKRLGDLIEGLSARADEAARNTVVTGIAVDSRAVSPGDLFVALRGSKTDGHAHAGEAVRCGAAAVLAEREVAVSAPVVRVASTERSLSPVAARFWNHPSRSLDVVGVTGTNGKTTITYLLESVWRAAGSTPGVLGTIDYRWAGRAFPAPNTTPHAAEVQRLLARMREDGVTRVAMEVSSHALALHRVEDVAFAGAVFTNLTQDHLDFHHDMESYFEAKAHLFALLAGSPRPVRRAVVNGDDPWAPQLLERLSVPVWTYGLGPEADIAAESPVLDASGCRFRARTPAGSRDVAFSLVGRHNVYNLLAALGAGLSLGASLDAAVDGLARVHGVPGRLERVTERPSGSPGPSRLRFSLFVDYAHTEDALTNVLTTLRPLTPGRLIVLFGCGGDRDRSKRPRMGEVAARLADHVIVTSDNPRSEDPASIAAEVAAGASRVPGRPLDIVLDRGTAVARAVEMAERGDVVLLAGKGHETEQIFMDRREPFDDRAAARERLADRAARKD